MPPTLGPATDSVTGPTRLDLLAAQAWPALETVEVDGWLLRLSAGVTQRANSVLPLKAPADAGAAVEQVEATYARHGLPATFQVGPASQPQVLDQLLDERGYAAGSPTLVQAAGVETLLAGLRPPAHRVDLADAPDEGWMDCWWAVDGRGDAAARAVARRILTGAPAVYASVRQAGATLAVARLALVEGTTWAGLYCVAVRPAARRRGCTSAVLAALAEAARDAGRDTVWLQVLEANAVARAGYARAGFADVSRYEYRTKERRA
ncbi:acetyltransferase (GNAT) family protein [Motilibacter peucedani]|uniref:Acetyltransferase (GNAT) family protein n=1 Tax=Motilibacter peucedani TaxID=598650 RepID=A0A420XQU2_9ACTN|nr:GNAT family N-acetyltransferase [Motilibacter peucedani]RKS75615.1 acetyltransferase (GNAT) family protein [Motilibacter peucedani]